MSTERFSQFQVDGFSSGRPKRRVIALGFFDGIHLGHAALLNRTREIGLAAGLVPSATTFDAHPLSVLRHREVGLINSAEDRAWLMGAVTKIEDRLIIHFDKEASQIPWDVFIEYLVDKFGACYFVCGEDFRFGKGGEGNCKLLTQKCNQLGLECEIFPQIEHDGVKVSSGNIRKLLLDGDIMQANALLGHPHMLSDTVRYGFRLGSKLGTPTTNMLFQDGVLVPALGVYATKVYIEDCGAFVSELSKMRKGPFFGVTNIGERSAVDASDKVTAQTHILNFRDNLYGRRVRIEFHEFIRPEINFSDLSELKAQIKRDCDLVKEHFKIK